MAWERLKGAAQGAVKGASDAKRSVTAEQLKEAVSAAVKAVKAEERHGYSGDDVDAIVDKAVAKALEPRKDQKSSKAPGESQVQSSICPAELERFMTDPTHTWIDPALKDRYNDLMGKRFFLTKAFKDLLKDVKDMYSI